MPPKVKFAAGGSILFAPCPGAQHVMPNTLGAMPALSLRDERDDGLPRLLTVARLHSIPLPHGHRLSILMCAGGRKAEGQCIHVGMRDDKASDRLSQRSLIDDKINSRAVWPSRLPWSICLMQGESAMVTFCLE